MTAPVNKKVSEEAAAGTLTGAETLRIVQGGATVRTTAQSIADLASVGAGPNPLPTGGTTGQTLAKASGTDYDVHWITPSVGGGVALAATAWVEVAGNDSTGVVGNQGAPFATLNGALDALVAVPYARIMIGVGTFPPVRDDAATPTTLDGGSKLRSNIEYIGAGRPGYDNDSAPTQLLGGTIIQGPWATHSTRHNVTIRNLGVDSGSAVCTALGYGSGEECLLFCNVGQVDVGTVGSSHNIQVHNVSTLGQNASAAFHSVLLENVVDSAASNLVTRYNAHGVVLKAVSTTVDQINGKGHSQQVLIIKESNTGNNTAPCHNVTVTNVVGGSLASADTPCGIRFHTASSRELRHIVVSGFSFTDVAADVDFEGSQLCGNIELVGVSNNGNGLTFANTGNCEFTTVSVNGHPMKPNWVTVASFSNGWTPYSGYMVQYNISRDGMVAIRGLITGGSGVAFTMPAGLRPPQDTRFPGVSYSGGFQTTSVVVSANGDVSLENGGNSFLSLDLKYYAG